jgi:hypothetical protein
MDRLLVGMFLALVALVFFGAIMESLQMQEARRQAQKLIKSLDNARKDPL